MKIEILPDESALGRAAARAAGDILREAIRSRGQARFIAATGASQFEFLNALVAEPGIEWPKTRMFHLDEYIGMSEDHPASFRRYLRERFTSRAPVGEVYWIIGDAADTRAECARLNALIGAAPIDVAFVGIGENGHLAFNDPPADFETVEPYIVVNLDDACRRQQVGEGWFAMLDDVPRQAISMSIRGILEARTIIGAVPGARKAPAVRDCLAGPVSPLHPASALQWHDAAGIYLDRESAGHL